MSDDLGATPERPVAAAPRTEWLPPDTQPENVPRLAPRARWVQRLLVAMLVLGVVALVSDLLEHALLTRLARGEATVAEADANDLRQSIVGIIATVVYIATIIFFLRWFHRADTPDELMASSTVSAVSDVLGIVAAIAAILLVRAMTARQDARIAALSEPGPALAPEPA